MFKFKNITTIAIAVAMAGCSINQSSEGVLRNRAYDYQHATYNPEVAIAPQDEAMFSKAFVIPQLPAENVENEVSSQPPGFNL